MFDYKTFWLDKIIADRFKVLKSLGLGGMGAIFLAFDNNLQKTVILKTPLIKDSSLKAEIADRFLREVHCLTTLEHPFIVPIIYTGTHEEHPFVVSRYINGGNLRDLINNAYLNHKTLPFESLYHWVPKIGAALSFMHNHDWIHRDVKPDNILFDTDHNCYLTDFGISKHLSFDPTNCLTSVNSVLGSPMYMAPEQHLGYNPTAKVDQYSLGVVIYEALTNKLPFNGRTQSAILLEIIRQLPICPKTHSENLEMPNQFNNALMKSLHFDPDQRHDSIEIFLEELFKGFDYKFKSNGFHKNTNGALLSINSPRLKTKIKIKKSKHFTDTKCYENPFKGLQNKMQKTCNRILNNQINLTPKQLTKVLNLLVASEVFDNQKCKEIITALESIFLLETNKTP